MIEAPPHPFEAERLGTLRSLNLLDTPLQERFERVTRMLSFLLDVPIAHFNLLDANRQHLKSAQGIDAVDVSRTGAFCAHTIHQSTPLIVVDAQRDSRFADNPFVTGGLGIRFYAGCPVRAPDGMPIGTLCAIDTRPRRIGKDRIALMLDLVEMLEAELRVSSLSRAHTQLIEQLGAAERLARIDPLTRLWNRAGILQLLEKEWAEAERHDKPVTVVMADIDHFKSVNDTYGHSAGDQVLIRTAKALLRSSRSEDVVGRLGGEEFLVILTACDPHNVEGAVERLRAGIEQEDFRVGARQLKVTISCGAAATVPHGNTDWRGLVDRADAALYRAKRMGRNRCEIDDDSFEARVIDTKEGAARF